MNETYPIGFGVLFCIMLSGLMSSTTTVAQPSTESLDFFKNAEVSIAGGINWTDANNSSLNISPFETDRAKVNHVSHNGLWKLGLGYSLFKEPLQQRQLFNALLLELNVYHSSGKIKGDVWQYRLPQFNNYKFNAPINSTRLMIDAKPGLLTWKSISPYPILGIGAAWNHIAYHESLRGIRIPSNSNLYLSSKTTTHVSYDLGFGARVGISEHITTSIEYLYTYLGNMTPSGRSDNHVRLASPPTFKVSTQAVLVGLTWKI
jgi:opacity protein-like surface antigen